MKRKLKPQAVKPSIYGVGAERGGGFSVLIVNGKRYPAALIVRRVNQGPAFDALLEKSERAAQMIDYIKEHSCPAPGGSDFPNWECFVDFAPEFRTALKLAQETR